MPRPISVGRVPLVGREPDLAFLADQLEAAGRGEGGVVLVSGEPGIGKSRLLAEVAARARAGGRLVLFGRAYDIEGMPPYLPFVEALGEHLRASPDDALGAALDDLREVATLIPELRSRYPSLPATPPLSAESQRYRLFEGVSAFLLRIARSPEAQGLLLCLDDLHWADRSSLLLFHHLARKIEGTHILVLGTYRTVGLDAAHPLSSTLAELTRERLDRRLALTPLSPSEMGALIERLNGAPVATVVATAIYRHTEGNPFFVEEIVRHLRSEQRDLASPRSVSAEWGVPPGIREVLGRRLSRLTPETYRLLQAAAVSGDRFSIDLVRAIGDVGTAAVTGAIEEASLAAIVREEDGLYRFSHPLVHEVVVGTLSLPRRQGLHHRAAEAMESLRAAGAAPEIAAVAAHYRQAGPNADPAKAIDYLLRAGTAAERVFAYEEAASCLESALAFMERAGRPPQECAGLYARLGALMYTSGFDNYPRCIAFYSRALELYDEAGERIGAGQAHLGLGRVLASAAATMDLPRALAHLKAAEVLLSPGPAGPGDVTLYRLLAQVATWQVRTEDGLNLSRQAMEISEQHGDDAAWPGAAMLHAFHLVGSGSLVSGFELMERACAAAERADQTFPGFMAAVWSGGRCFWLADSRGAQGYYERELPRPRLTQAPLRRRALLSDLAASLALAGDLAEAERLLVEEVGDDVLDQGAETYARPLVAFFRGDLDLAETLWSRATQHHQAAGNRWSEATFDWWLAKLDRLRGDAAQAEGRLRSVLDVGQDGPHLPLTLWAGCELALLYAEQQRTENALPLLEHCRAIAGNGEDWRGLAGRVALVGAAIAAGAGSLDEAKPQFERAIALFRRYDLPWDEAEALRIWGGALLARRGRRDRACGIEKLDSARAIYQRLGAGEPWIRLVERDRQRLLPPDLADGALLPDGLTAREVEVLRLIARGMSSREIGEELVLSVRTVERHVANIYLKTNTHGRAQATAYALTRRLL